MKALLVLALFGLGFRQIEAQDLTVRVIDQSTNKPLTNVLIRLHYGCQHSMRPVELKRKTDSNGIAIFRSVSVSPLEFCVFPDDDAFASREQPFLFAAPKDAPNYDKYLGKVVIALPTEITFHVRKLTFGERLRNLFRYD